MRVFLFIVLLPYLVFSQNTDNSPFRQMYDLLPTANNYRTATGAPGHEYYQCRADYNIIVELDDITQRIYGEETVTFYNNSPDVLNYLWIQLDQNQQSKTSDSHTINQESISDKEDINFLNKDKKKFDGGFKLEYVKDLNGKNIPYYINKTMMRLDLSSSIKKSEKYIFKIKYWYNINDRMKLGGRSSYEYFKEDDNYLYTIAQFFPRMCAYNDIDGKTNNS